MRLELPLNYEDITIDQLLKHGTRELSDIEKVQIYAGITYDEIQNLPIKLIQEGARHIDSTLACPTTKHHKIIKVKGVEYGFIPDWSEFTTGEYVDSEEYTKSIERNAHKLMAIMYRPITRKFGDKYEIKPYEGTRDAEKFREVSASYLNGMLVFFWNIRRELAVNSVRSLDKQMREMRRKQFQASGDGITQSFSWLKRTFSKLKRSRKNQSHP